MRRLVALLLAVCAFGVAPLVQGAAPSEPASMAPATGAPLAAVTAAPTATAPVTPEADRAVLRALEGLGQDYTIDPEGDFKLELGFDDKRSQVVFINSATELLVNLRLREVWAIAMVYTGDQLPAELPRALLVENSRKKLGGWQLRELGERSALVYCMQVPADLAGESLKAAYLQTAIIADEKEKELSGDKDAF
jgi:hypothetical protein